MPEKHMIELAVKLPEEFVDALKSQLRAGGHTPMSATQAVYKALELFGSTAKSVRLDEPERRELESRSGATVPIRKSRDILLAAERMAGGPNAVLIDMDPGILGLIKDHARDLGFGVSDFCCQIVTEGYLTQFLETCEFHPLYFDANEWRALTERFPEGRIRTGGQLLSLLMEFLPPNGEPRSPSIALNATAAKELTKATGETMTLLPPGGPTAPTAG